MKKVACKGAGAGILQDIPKMVSMTKAIVDSTHLPVTVKTRLGGMITRNILLKPLKDYKMSVYKLFPSMVEHDLKCKREADWTLISKVKNPRMHIPVFGNGDIDSPQKGSEYREKYELMEL